ncbi:bacterio-opsin activator domain-containing protein [Halobacteriaceae archaeon GCM10025711]
MTDHPEETRHLDAVFARTLAFRVDADGTVLEASGEGADHFWLDPSEAVGKPLWEFGLVARAETRDELRDAVERAASGDVAGGTIEIRAADSSVPIDYTIAPVADGEPTDESQVTETRDDACDRTSPSLTMQRRFAELVRLDRIHRLVDDVIRSSMGRTTRDELERAVCAELVDEPFYTAAWVGEWSIEGEGLTPRMDVDASLVRLAAEVVRADVEVATPDEPDETTYRQRASEDSRLSGDARLAAREHGSRSLVVLSLRYGESNYGVLVVHSSRPDAFKEAERSALESLAAVVGLAIYARRQEQLLIGDTVTELKLSAVDSAAVFSSLATRCECRVEVDTMIPRPDGLVLQFLSVDGAPVDRVRDAITDQEAVDTYRLLEERGRHCQLEVCVQPDEFLSRLTGDGVVVRSAVAEPDEQVLVLEVAPDVDLQDVVAGVRRGHAEWSVAGKRTIDRPGPTHAYARQTLTDRLTEKQLAALQTAYAAGYYDFPRKSTATEIAAALDIADSTLFQHLQAAQRKLIEECVEPLVHPSSDR